MTKSFSKDYKILDQIGEGSFSEVLKVEHIETGTKFAAKRLKQIYKSLDELKACVELEVLRKLEVHPNIVGLIELIVTPLPGYITLIFELMDMSLHDFLQNRKRTLPELKVKRILYQLTCGIEHLHRNDILHRDIKPENILIKLPVFNRLNNRDEIIKLADLGSVCCLYNESPPHTPYISTRWYRSPECLLGMGYYDNKMDIWSLGCVFYEMITLTPLFPGDNELDQLTKIHEVLGSPCKSLLQRFKNRKDVMYSFPKSKPIGFHNLLPLLSCHGQDLLKRSLEYHPDFRIDIGKFKDHSYFENFTKTTRKSSSTYSLLNTHLNGSNSEINFKTKINLKRNEDYKIQTVKKIADDYVSDCFDSYESMLRKKEKAWGMSPGPAKAALLKRISGTKIK